MQKTFNRFSLRGLLLTASLFAAPSAQAQSGYTITDLGSLDGNYSAAYGISNSGLVCGVAGLTVQVGLQTGVVPRPVVFSNGQVTNLGTFMTHPIPINQQVAKASGINDSGQVVGYASTNTNSEAFLYSNGTLQQTLTTQNAINNNGDRVGGPSFPNNDALLYSNGVYTHLGTLGGVSSVAYALNNVGQIVGQSDLSGNNFMQSAFLYQNGKMQDIGKDTTLFNTSANGINDSGMVVGVGFATSNNTGERGFIWKNGSVQFLGTLGGVNSGALGINNSGTIIGYYQPTLASSEPFVYKNGQMSDLFAGSGWSGGEATAINDNGWIVGYGVSPSGYSRAFLAKPNATPAPGSLLTLSIGVGVMLLAVRRRKRTAASR